MFLDNSPRIVACRYASALGFTFICISLVNFYIMKNLEDDLENEEKVHNLCLNFLNNSN